MLNFTGGDPMAQTYERYDNMKHTPGARQPSAGMHPEDRQWIDIWIEFPNKSPFKDCLSWKLTLSLAKTFI